MSLDDSLRGSTTSGETDGMRRPVPARPIIAVVAFSMAAGAAAAIGSLTVPLLPPHQGVLVGAILISFGLGWALLYLLSRRLTDQPQRWAAAPALFLAAAGIINLSEPSGVHGWFGWVWPPALVVVGAWALRRIRRQLASRGARWMLYPIAAVLVVAGLGGGYQTVQTAHDTKAYRPPGSLIEVGGRRLHLQCSGSGRPTVVLEPGAGASSSDMAWVAPQVARHTRVCTYDRAGRGWSDPTDEPQDAEHIAADLHALLVRADVEGPYVLAGHSFGGLYAMSFAAQYPDEVAGLVLLDSTAPRLEPPSTDAAALPGALRRLLAVLPATADLGLWRLLGHLTPDSLPPRAAEEARATTASAHHLASCLDEYLLEAPASLHQAAALSDFDGKPLLVLTAGRGHDARWLTEQEHLATLSTDSQQRIAPQATHASLLSDPGNAATAGQAVLAVVDAVRGHRTLRSS